MERELSRFRLKLTSAVLIDYPGAAEILVSFPDEWELVHRLSRDDTPLYIAGMPPSQERQQRDHFYGLSPNINLEMTTYRQYRLFEPWPQHNVTISWDQTTGTGQVEEVGEFKIQLRTLGQAQAWYGHQHGVIWECYFHQTRRSQPRWQDELMEFWLAVERDIEVAKVFTQPHDPAFEEGYTEFLSRLGYSPDPHHLRWWSKPVGQE